MSAREEFPMTNWQPIVRRYCLEEATYDAMCDRIDTLTEQNQLLRNLIGNAEGAALDAGLLGDTLPHDSIYALAVERDTLTAQLAELRAAVARAKWAHDEFDPPLPAAYELTAEAELFALVPSDGSWAEQ